MQPTLLRTVSKERTAPNSPKRRPQLTRMNGALFRCVVQRFGVVADAIAMLQPGAREAAIVHVFETGAVGRLNAAVAAQTGEIYQDVAAPPTFSQTVHSNSAAFDTWSRIKDLLARLDPQQPRSHLHANAMASLFLRSAIQSPAAAEAAFAAFADADEVLRAS